MSTDTARRSARTAINQELQWLMHQPIPEEVKLEIWRIEKLAAVNDAGAALNEIHDKALDLSGIEMSDRIREVLHLVMSIARYQVDVRSIQEQEKHRHG